MKAFHDDHEIKNKYLKRVKAHALADEIVKGHYWQNGKGCAVGCTIHGSDHKKYETELGVPEWLARVEDTIFEGLENSRAKLWPEQFLNAIKPGADLEKIKVPFLVFILEQNLTTLDSLPDMTEFPDVKNAIDLTRKATKEVIRCHLEGLDLSAAESAARSAAKSAWSAAESAAWSAAESAAWSAAKSAWSAAWSAAESAAESARSAAESAESAAESARSAAYERFADKLIELIDGCL